MERGERWRRRRIMEAEPEGETEMPESGIVADGVEGTLVDHSGEGHQDEGTSTKKKSEETQDYVREANDLNQEKSEETSFVPSATSVPQTLMFRCDNQCSEETLGFWQLAPVVIREGEESYTTNLCQNCYNDSLKAKGEKTPTNWQNSRGRRRTVEGFGR